MKRKTAKKRLTAIAASFLLLTGIGGIFAFIGGQIDIAGTVRIAAEGTDYVYWDSVHTDFFIPTSPLGGFSPASISPMGGYFGAEHTANIINNRGRTNQTIVWDINFNEAGFAGITAIARNNTTENAIITRASAGFTDFAPGFTLADFGLSLDVDDIGFVGQTMAPDSTLSMQVFVDWDGTIPPGFYSGGEDHTFAASLEVVFDYAPAP